MISSETESGLFQPRAARPHCRFTVCPCQYAKPADRLDPPEVRKGGPCTCMQILWTPPQGRAFNTQGVICMFWLPAAADRCAEEKHLCHGLNFRHRVKQHFTSWRPQQTEPSTAAVSHTVNKGLTFSSAQKRTSRFLWCTLMIDELTRSTDTFWCLYTHFHLLLTANTEKPDLRSGGVKQHKTQTVYTCLHMSI